MSVKVAVAPRPATKTSSSSLDINRCLEGIRKDFRDASQHCNNKGYYRLIITPHHIAVRAANSSSVRADFGQFAGCANSVKLRQLYRKVAEEEFIGITVDFSYETTISVMKGGEQGHHVNMLAVVFKVPVSSTNGHITSR